MIFDSNFTSIGLSNSQGAAGQGLDKSYQKTRIKIGDILILVCAFGLMISLFTEQWIVLVASLIGIPLIFAYLNVVGSAFRAIGLYIQVRVK